MDKLKRFEKVLHQYCQRHLNNGGTLISGQFCVDNHHCCPIRATVIPIPPISFFQKMMDKIRRITSFPETSWGKSMVPSYSDSLSKKLGLPISNEEVSSFYKGYDNKGYLLPDDQNLKAFFQLGKKFREQYQPIDSEKVLL